jgi:hypothetical protein
MFSTFMLMTEVRALAVHVDAAWWRQQQQQYSNEIVLCSSLEDSWNLLDNAGKENWDWFCTSITGDSSWTRSVRFRFNIRKVCAVSTTASARKTTVICRFLDGKLHTKYMSVNIFAWFTSPFTQRIETDAGKRNAKNDVVTRQNAMFKRNL